MIDFIYWTAVLLITTLLSTAPNNAIGKGTFMAKQKNVSAPVSAPVAVSPTMAFAIAYKEANNKEEFLAAVKMDEKAAKSKISQLRLKGLKIPTMLERGWETRKNAATAEDLSGINELFADCADKVKIKTRKNGK